MVKGEEGDSEDDTDEAFDVLLIDVGEDVHYSDSGHSEHFFTSVESLLTEPTEPTALTTTTSALIDTLNFLALTHQITGEIPTSELAGEVSEDAYTFTTSGTSRYDSRCFYRVVIDTGASRYSIAGLEQFQALQRINKSVILNDTTKGQVIVQFNIGSTSSIGSTLVTTPIGQVEFYIMLVKTLFLLSLADIDKLRVYFNNLTNSLITSTSSNVLVVRRFGHSFLL